MRCMLKSAKAHKWLLHDDVSLSVYPVDSIAGASVVVTHMWSMHLVTVLCVSGGIVLGWYMLYVDCRLLLDRILSNVWIILLIFVVENCSILGSCRVGFSCSCVDG